MSQKHAATPSSGIPASPSRRYHSLDGLRGVAAMVVVCCHLLLVVTAFSQAQSTSSAPVFSAAWWIYKTPLQLFFAGQASVLVFFVLSGFVLALPLRPRPGRVWRWGPYYARRVVRLYLPVWAAIVFALVLALVVTRDPASDNPWIASHQPPTLVRTLRDLLLLGGTSNLNSPLWSLRWEMWFSLLLPVLALGIRFTRMNRWWPVAIVVLLAISAGAKFAVVGEVLPGAFITVGLVQYLPVFGVGMLLAFNLNDLHAVGARLHSRRWAGIAFVGIVVAIVLLVTWPTIRDKPSSYDLPTALATFGSLLAMPLVIFLAIEARPFVRVLETRPVQWLGSRSFSIYLVHEPVVVAIALLVRPSGTGLWLLLAVALIPVLLVVASLFFRLVERPAHHLSRRAGEAVERRRGAPADATTVPTRVA